VNPRVDKVYDTLYYYGYNKDDAMRLSKRIVKNLDNYISLQQLMLEKRRTGEYAVLNRP